MSQSPTRGSIGSVSPVLAALRRRGTDDDVMNASMDSEIIRDILDSLVKSGVFGFIVASVACFQGLRARGGTEGVGRTTTSAVVIGCVWIFVADFFVTKMLLLL